MVTEKRKAENEKDADKEQTGEVIIDEGKQSGDEEKNVSVKGVQKTLYRRILDLASETGRTVGELTNDAYKALLSTASGAKEISQHLVEGAKQASIQSIDNITELEITGPELKEMKRKVSFNHIKKLEISDISDEDFCSIVAGIHNVDELTVSSKVKKASVLKVCSFVNKIKLE